MAKHCFRGAAPTGLPPRIVFSHWQSHPPGIKYTSLPSPATAATTAAAAATKCCPQPLPLSLLDARCRRNDRRGACKCQRWQGRRRQGGGVRIVLQADPGGRQALLLARGIILASAKSGPLPLMAWTLTRTLSRRCDVPPSRGPSTGHYWHCARQWGSLHSQTRGSNGCHAASCISCSSRRLCRGLGGYQQRRTRSFPVPAAWMMGALPTWCAGGATRP